MFIKACFSKLLLPVCLVRICSCADLSAQADLNTDTARANAYVTHARVFLNSSAYDSAEYLLDQAQPIYIRYFGEKCLQNASLLHVKGLLYYFSSKYEQALECYSKSLSIRLSLLGEKDPDVALSYSNLGVVYLILGEADKAIECHEKSLSIRRALFGEEHPDVADSYNNIGNTMVSKNDFDQALENYNKSLVIRRKLYGEKHPDVALLYNNIGLVYHYQGLYDKALLYYNQSLEIQKALYGEKSVNVADYYNNIGTLYQDRSQFDESLRFYLKSLAIRRELLGENNLDVAISYNNIGNIYEARAEYDKSLDYYSRSLSIRRLLLGDHNPDVAASYTNVGSVYQDRNEFGKALEYYSKGLGIRREQLGEKHLGTASSYNNIGNIYFQTQAYDQALEYFMKSLSIMKELLGENNSEVADEYNNIGNVCQAGYHNEQALDYFSRSLAMYKSLFGENHADVAMVYTNLGTLYRDMGQYGKALGFYAEGNHIYKTLLGEKNASVADSYQCMAETFRMQGNYPAALDNAQKAIASCMETFSDTSQTLYAPIVSGYSDWHKLLESLHLKAGVLARLGRTKSDPLLLSAALAHFMACDTLIDLTRRKINSQSDKLTLGEEASSIYEEAIAVCSELEKAGKEGACSATAKLAFYFSEKNKSAVLLESLAGQEAQQYAGIPRDLLAREHALQVDIALYTKQLAQPENLDSATLLKLQDDLFSCNRSCDSLLSIFEKQYPRYHELKYSRKTASVADIQQLLDPKTELVSFLVGDSTLTSFALTKNAFSLQVSRKPASFADSIALFRHSLTHMGRQSQSDYLRLARSLYILLFPADPGRDIENLILIPDNGLSLIPFEVLLTGNLDSAATFDAMPYLLKKYSISYAYSATLFALGLSEANELQPGTTPQNDWLAIAPVFSDDYKTGMTLASKNFLTQMQADSSRGVKTRGTLLSGNSYIPPLPGTEDEVERIFAEFDRRNLRARVALKDSANEAFVKSGEPGKYRILHFATHGFVNSERPELSGLLLAQDSIGGQDGILFSGEIYNLRLNASLTVLSACETGLGKIRKGEGLIGLTRALMYAGTRNIIVSLWQVSDQSTSNLMVDFYKNLLNHLNNQGYAEDLRKAKLKMIAGKTFAHPFYWSPFILIGK